MNTKNISIGVLVVLALVFGVLYYQAQSQLADLGRAGIGPTHYQTENFLQGLYGGTVGQFKVSNAGKITVASTTYGIVLQGSGLQVKGSDSTSCYTLQVSNGSVVSAATSTCQ